MLRIPITPLLIILFNDLLIRLHVRDTVTFCNPLSCVLETALNCDLAPRIITNKHKSPDDELYIVLTLL